MVPTPPPTPNGPIGRAWRAIQWLIPATFLMLIPKCPMCVASYVALFTGIGIGFSTARAIQILMVVLCVAALAFLTFNFWRRYRNLPIQITLRHT
jgi:hypothetical protein